LKHTTHILLVARLRNIGLARVLLSWHARDSFTLCRINVNKMPCVLKIMKFSKKEKGKAAPLQAWSGPEGSRKLRLPDVMTTAQDGGKVVSLTHRPPLPTGNTSGTYFC